MLRRALSLCAVLGMVSYAHAGAIVTLNPSAPVNPAGYQPGETVRVDVFVQLDASSPATIRTRLIQFDITDSNDALGMTPVLNHPGADIGAIPFWNLLGSTTCANDEASCGTNYFIDGSLADATPSLLNMTYTGLTSSGSFMVVLRQASPTLVGSLDVQLPGGQGEYLLDLLNADETDINLGAEIRHGFGSTSDPGSFTLRANSGQITGGQARLVVVPEPATLAMLGLGGLAAAYRRRRAA